MPGQVGGTEGWGTVGSQAAGQPGQTERERKRARLEVSRLVGKVGWPLGLRHKSRGTQGHFGGLWRAACSPEPLLVLDRRMVC